MCKIKFVKYLRNGRLFAKDLLQIDKFVTVEPLNGEKISVHILRNAANVLFMMYF